MSFPNENNPYAFDEFLNWRKNVDYYQEDLFLQKVIQYHVGDEWKRLDEEARKISSKVSFRWRDIADEIARPEKRPFILHYDGHHHRIDRIVRPAETEIMEKEVFSEKLFSKKTSKWERLIKMYLIYQNGEACISCPLTCTEGLVTLLEKFAETPETLRILQHCKEGLDLDYGIGAQYLSEIQGGSDVQANLLKAIHKGDHWQLYGKKFFCSATHANYAVVTAKPSDSEDVALFIVPSWLPGDKAKEKRNGYTIDRIKWKLGTSELTTAELTYDGAIAYPMGPLNRGISNVVGIVLTYSRLTVGLSSAASMVRAVREAEAYSQFRSAFGQTLNLFPLLANQLRTIKQASQRSTAGAFKLYHEFLDMERGQEGHHQQKEEELLVSKKKRFCIRELILFQKITTSWDATDVLRTAMSIFGGHGVMEDFSSLPRLYRDAAINELWEGPRNVLLSQIHRDFQKASVWYTPAEFIRDTFPHADLKLINELSQKMTALISHPGLTKMDEQTMDICQQWDQFCHQLYHAYQDQALAELDLI
ncbi:acyl-CoA dehydrogenase family protein [Deltaproteobacteria bacterium TL4]